MIRVVGVSDALEKEWKELIKRVVVDGWDSKTKTALLKFEYEKLLPLQFPYVLYDVPNVWMKYTALPWSPNELDVSLAETMRNSLACFTCPLVLKQHVIGGGNIYDPKYAFIGDAPGAGNVKDIIPVATTFCNGPTSKIVRSAAHAVGILQQSYFSNMLKCALPGNRAGNETEYKNCRKFISAELMSFPNLEIIFSLGKASFTKLLSMTFTNAKVVPLLHPAYFLRSSRTAVDDFVFHIKTQITPELYNL